MAKWVLDWHSVLEYPTLGFHAEPGDILDAVYAPDARWSQNANQAAAETVYRFAIGGDPDYIEPTNGHVLTYDAARNGYVPTAPASVGLPSVDAFVGEKIANDPASDSRAAVDARIAALPPAAATASASGLVELATSAEAATGTDAARAVTPAAGAATYARKAQMVVGASNADHATIAAALAVATSGDEILLRPGTFTISGANTIPAGVKLRSLQPGATSIEGSYSTTQSAFTLQAGASIEGVTIRNTHATGDAGVHVAADLRGAGATVRDCTFVGPWAQAILGYLVTDVRITDCLFDTVGRTSGSTPGDAINLYGVNGAVVSGCLFRDCKQNALYVNASAKNVTITGNTVRGCPEGVQVRVSCSNVTITGNTFDIKGASGITSFGVIVQTQCTDTVVANNTFRTTAGTGTPIAAITIDDRSHRAIVEGNSISGSGYAKGISVATTAGVGTESINCVVSGNTLDSTAGVSIDVASGHVGAVVSGNRIIGGTNKAIWMQSDRASVVGNVVTANSGFDGITIAGAFCSVTGNVVTDVGANAGILVSGTDNTIAGNMCTSNNTYGINDTGNSNVIVGNNCGGNDHATTDILSAGAASKVAYNIGRYTAKGAA